MTDNHIAYDKELEKIELQLKELSKIYQDEYEENGKYFKTQNPRFILWCNKQSLILYVNITKDGEIWLYIK